MYDKMSPYQERRCSCFWNLLTPFTRFLGIVTAIVLCGVGVDFSYHHYTTGVYIIVTAAIVFLLEITWLVTLFLHVCLRNEYSPVYRYWDLVLWMDGWKKTVLYTAFSIVLFVRPHRLWLCFAAGLMLLLLACLYLATSCMRRRVVTKDTLLPSRDDSLDNRYDEIPELLDDTMPGPVSDGLSDNLIDQDAILEM